MDRLSKTLLVLATLVASGLLFSKLALAMSPYTTDTNPGNRPDNVGRSDSPGRSGEHTDRPTIPAGWQLKLATNSGEGTKSGEFRLDAGKLRACEARGEAIKKRSGQLLKMATNMVNVFDTIAQRVETYYTSKVVPSGKTVPNYNSLVSDIASRSATVKTDLAKAQTDAANFSCTGSDPKGQMAQFNQDMKVVKDALKDFRTAVKNLIVAVRSITGETNRNATESGEATPGAKPFIRR